MCFALYPEATYLTLDPSAIPHPPGAPATGTRLSQHLELEQLP